MLQSNPKSLQSFLRGQLPSPDSMVYSLKDVNTRDIEAVACAVRDVFRKSFPGTDAGFITRRFDTIADMFDGRYKTYGKVSTEYHNREHTLQAGLCMCRLMEGWIIAGRRPPLEEWHFRVGLTAILMHDVGYLTDRADQDGTGAKYTNRHEERGKRMAIEYLREMGEDEKEIRWVGDLILCTGPNHRIHQTNFENEIAEFLGRATCTADYLGQMADYQYLRKLPILYREFEESDHYNGIPEEKRLFQSARDLIEKTPGFWRFVQSKVLSGDCRDVYKLLARPYPDGPNAYIEKVNRNIRKIEKLVEEDQVGELVKGVS